MKTLLFFSTAILFCSQLQSQWTSSGNNYTTGQLAIGASQTWAPITITSVSNATKNEGVSLAFDGTDHSEMGYRFKVDGANYYQVMYNGLAINWKHYEADDYVTKLSLTNSGSLGIGTSDPSAELEVKSVADDNAEIHINSSTNGRPSIIRFQDAGTDTWGLLSHYPHQDKLSVYNYHNGSNAMVFDSNGNIGIGTTTPDTRLAVNGNIHTKEVKVDLIGWPDFVFENNYELPTLQEVEAHIAHKGHLQDIPSAKEVEENGVHLGEMNAKLLQKIEELMLYTIQQQKEIERLSEEVLVLKSKGK
ncbi:hypothetical protein LV716_06130 [Flagellimonas sp. HMM57]|uniref:hypothetical protein n=1 Tax=unclassified Flagellimonas TaxID=2644544 RepID=UPI0013D7E51A|nr:MULTISPECIES: hypothetical protein [unclassified Flagellimonas]UII77347.1 hypothetical protein LV716_06130 [Flagellimonas sp. HMM57]